MTSIKKQIQNRNANLIREWKTTIKTVNELCLEFGLQPRRLLQIVKGYERPLGISRNRRRKRTDEPLSKTHKFIGAKIRAERTTQGKGDDKTMFAMAVGISPQQLTGIEEGTVDPTLGQLIRISKALEIPIHEILMNQVRVA